MANTIQMRRGANGSLPTLDAAEFGFSTDTKQLYIGDGVANHELVIYDIFDAKGDLVVGTGPNTANKLTVGATAGYVLTVDSGETTGLKWTAGNLFIDGGSASSTYITPEQEIGGGGA